MRLIDYLRKINRPEKILWYLGRDTFLRYTDDETYLKIAFKAYLGYSLNLQNPKTFNEKLQWLKLNDKNPLYTKLVDKYEVKDYVKEKIGGQAVIRTLKVWDCAEEIKFDQLPEKFVLKCTHDSGGGYNLPGQEAVSGTKSQKEIEKAVEVQLFFKRKRMAL